MSSLQGMVALVTGAAKGIGFAICQSLGRAGVSLVLADIDPTALSNAHEALTQEDITATSVVCDVGDKSSVDFAVATAVDKYGSLHIAVANAGIVRSAPFLETSEEDFDDVLRVNLKGCFLTCQAAAKQMIKQEDPSICSIINISSVNAITAIPSLSGYNASKGGINNLTRNMAISLAPYGIRVNAVAPGSVMTDMLKKVALDKETMRDILSRTPLLRAADPLEIGNIVKFLASKDASYIDGQIMYADGGRLALNYTVPVPDE